MSLTGTYAWNAKAKSFVKVSDKPPLKGTPALATMNFTQQVMAGYKRCEERGDRTYYTKRNIKRIWNT